MNNPAAHGFSEVLYEFSSASANNGSEFGGLNTAWGSYDPKSPEPPVPWNPPWDIATALVMLLGRFLPGRRSHGHGRQPGGKETNSFYRGNDADRHIYFRLRAAGNDPPGGRVVVPAGGGPWPCRRTFWPLAVWRLNGSASDDNRVPSLQLPLENNDRCTHNRRLRRRNSNWRGGRVANRAFLIRNS